MQALILLFASLALGAPPDRAPRPDEWGYRPADGSTVAVNPPAITWVNDGGLRFELQWSRDARFEKATTVRDIPWSAYTHNRPLEPGRYYWRYRAIAKDGAVSDWSATRSFMVPPDAAVFPQPAMDELRTRIPRDHPRLFVTRADIARLRASPGLDKLRERAGQLLAGDPTPEPAVMGSSSNPQTVDHWWSNRVQTMKACQEAEVLAFVYLLTGEEKYGQAARRWILHLAAWNPDGPTNWKLNDEAAMPILHRLPRAYDWAFDALSEEERARVRAVMLRRAQDAWNAGQIGRGEGHLNRPYNSHGNRAWHKLAENAIATFGETPEPEMFLRYAVTKFFAAYPVWSDDDGGWHEGLSYWAGYMSKAAWWMDVARVALGIDGFKKPFFAHFADYAMYTAPPGSPDGGFGDLASRGASPGWSFVHYFTAAAKHPYWAWWAKECKIQRDPGEPVLAFLWDALPAVEPKPPTRLPPSKVFRGIGVAVLNTTLLAAVDNVQVRLKSSPFGRQSHGHDPHNSFTLNAYGDALIANNVYRDLYGSPFHAKWVWTTRAQNALLVNGEGQKPHSADLGGRLAGWEFQDGLDYVAGDAAASYEGKLKRFLRHVIFLKPDLVVIADDIDAEQPSTFQWMLHSAAPFETAGQRLMLEREHAGVLVDYVAPEPLKLRTWTGYDPAPNYKYLESVKNARTPDQWHVEASTTTAQASAFVLTVMRPYRNGQRPAGDVRVERERDAIVLDAAGASLRLSPREFTVQKEGKTWKITAASY